MGADLWLVVYWWAVLFFVGVAAFPLSRILFHRWWDHGYGLSKGVGIAAVTYTVWLWASVRLIPFSRGSIYAALALLFILGILGHLVATSDRVSRHRIGKPVALRLGKHVPPLRIVLMESMVFVSLLFWSWVKGHEASIRSLEKFMDFGFTQSILNSAWFPAPDMWYAGETINYYTFGHTMMAVLTKLSGVDLSYAFNLMLATLFALCLSMSFTLGTQLMLTALRSEEGRKRKLRTRTVRITSLCAGALTALFVTVGGNLQTIYAFTRGYVGEAVRPFWELWWSDIPSMIGGIPNYWYANATRFIPLTIHEFPGYSFVVSDVHGHVLGIPLALLAISVLLTGILMYGPDRLYSTATPVGLRFAVFLGYGFLVSILFMTNALDGPIYAGLFLVCTAVYGWGFMRNGGLFHSLIFPSVVMLGSFMFFSLPFLLSFDSFVSGVGVNCPIPPFVNTTLGPFLFEGVEKCQHSPLWMLLVLWGFFIFNGLLLLFWGTRFGKKGMTVSFTPAKALLVLLFVYCMGLLLFPEFFYFKDIYPAHFRSNTMFKLGYQAFIMLSVLSAHAIVSYTLLGRSRIRKVIFGMFVLPQIFLVLLYPFLATMTYFQGLKTYEGLYGFIWFSREYPYDYRAISFLADTRDSRVLKSKTDTPVLLEAEGESYTDYARFSAITGIPTVVGWPVHEWLWRGTYDVVSPRVEDVKAFYEGDDPAVFTSLRDKYGITYVVVGQLERKKYGIIREDILGSLGRVVFEYGGTRIYELD